MDDIKYIKLRTKNAKMMQMFGDKLTKSEWARSMRTNGLHTEIQHSDRYGGISFSCTLSDGCNGCRFKMIGYSHPYRWSTVYIPVTAEQEARLFAKGCEMADIVYPTAFKNEIIHQVDREYRPVEFRQSLYKCIYGPNHIKYDKGAAFFSFISKCNIWKPSETKMICNRACGEVLMEVWPDVFALGYRAIDGICRDVWMKKISIPPHAQTPDDTEYLTRHYIDNIVKEIE